MAPIQQLFAYISSLGIWVLAKDLKGLDSCFVQGPTHCHPKLGFINRNFDVVTQRNVKCTWLVSSRWHLLPVIRRRSLCTSPHCVLASELPRKQQNQALGGTVLTARPASAVGISLPRPEATPRQPTQDNWLALTPLVVQQKNPDPSLEKTDVVVRLFSVIRHMLQQKTNILYTESWNRERCCHTRWQGQHRLWGLCW